ncbi:uncharacterized protein METZ01_LOCUS95947 [marine metagenome]|uniref:Uncharacterized protein n=1 Tax=marine metagenome TaxID=408172 RepID=A0A381VU53_9ZZZZ
MASIYEENWPVTFAKRGDYVSASPSFSKRDGDYVSRSPIGPCTAPLAFAETRDPALSEG